MEAPLTNDGVRVRLSASEGGLLLLEFVGVGRSATILVSQRWLDTFIQGAVIFGLTEWRWRTWKERTAEAADHLENLGVEHPDPLVLMQIVDRLAQP